jgi:cell division protein FtsB
MMNKTSSRPPLGGMIYLALAFAAGAYFTFAAVQGDFGVFRQVQIAAEVEGLTLERDALQAELDRVMNRTLRLSDAYLDMDLLDQQVRDILGYVRADEIVIR